MADKIKKDMYFTYDMILEEKIDKNGTIETDSDFEPVYTLNDVMLNASEDDETRLHNLVASGSLNIENPAVTFSEMQKNGIYDYESDARKGFEAEIVNQIANLFKNGKGENVASMDVFTFITKLTKQYIKKCKECDEVKKETKLLMSGIRDLTYKSQCVYPL